MDADGVEVVVRGEVYRLRRRLVGVVDERPFQLTGPQLVPVVPGEKKAKRRRRRRRRRRKEEGEEEKKAMKKDDEEDEEEDEEEEEVYRRENHVLYVSAEMVA